MENILLGAILLASHLSAQAAPMLRFWRGYKLDALPMETFVDGLNRKFIPWTASLGTTSSGMIGYLPVVSKPVASSRIPEEFALVVYASEEQYRKFRATPEGQAYSDGHWEYFDKTLSKSAVVENLTTEAIEHGKAYAVTSYGGRWDTGYARFALVKRSEFGSLDDVQLWLTHENVEGVDENGQGHLGRVVLVEANYIATYDLWSSKEAFVARNNDSMDAPEDFADYYVKAYRVGELVLDIELLKGLRNLGLGEGLQAPIAP